MKPHPPPSVSAGRLVRDGGRAAPCFCLTLRPWGSLTAAQGGPAEPEPRPHPGGLREELMHAHSLGADRPEIKNGLHKEVSMFTQSVQLCQYLKERYVSEWVEEGETLTRRALNRFKVHHK